MLRLEARSELAGRLPAKPWTDLVKSVPAGTLDGFGGPLDPKWLIGAALVRDGTLYYQDSRTAYGPYPYPLEMRFGVRSVMKSVGVPLLNRQLTMDLLAARGALREDGDQSAMRATPEGSHSYAELYKMGFHFIPFTGSAGRLVYLPTMSGSGENEVTLYPNHVISIVMAKAAELPAGERAFTDKGPETLRAAERLAPF